MTASPPSLVRVPCCGWRPYIAFVFRTSNRPLQPSSDVSYFPGRFSLLDGPHAHWLDDSFDETHAVTYLQYVLLFGNDLFVCLHFEREGLIMSNLTDDQIGKIKIRFNEYDKDGDGFIAESELKEILGDYLADDEVSEMFKKIDTNGDGRVSFDEFYKAN
ncbi:EF-hand domain-containing protein [Burkholderia ubonensis]|uniref:EF-hand domain-containing protein n=1 Tax=Burkholderia ubonensis TaxID=101571 RepID=UPI0018E12DB0|nr:EF-hand domain-containing protein [Burkholderia ubonensis]